MHFHRKLLKKGEKLSITRKSKTTREEVSENTYFVCFRSRSLFVRRGTPVAKREKPSLFIFFDKFGCNFGSAENESWG
jgi:hypothetical protein